MPISRSFFCLVPAVAIWQALLLAPSCHGAGLVVSPVRVELSAKQQTAMITLENQGKIDEQYQLELTEWSQEDGRDIYKHTRELVAAPRMFNLRPGQSQIIRIGLKELNSRPESSYRLFIQQLPGARSQTGVSQGIQTLLRVGVPVFVRGDHTVKDTPKLTWSAIRQDGQVVGFEIENPSMTHVQVGKIRMGGEPLGTVGLYVLPGQRRSWMSPLALPSIAETFTIEAETDQGTMVYDNGAAAR